MTRPDTNMSKYHQMLSLDDERRDMSIRHASELSKAVSKGACKERHAREIAELEVRWRAL